MKYFVFRNNTIERFFPADYSFSGYDDVSLVPDEAEGYVWFYQLPVKYDAQQLCDEVQGYAQKLEWVLSRAGQVKPFLILTMAGGYSVPFTAGHDIRSAIAGYNAALLLLEQAHANVKVLDISEFTRNYPEAELVDWKYWFLSQMGLNPRLSVPFQEWFDKKLDEVALKRKKCLVLDLDNTLWGGVLGEDGMDGIKLSGDYPGKAFHYFQEGLLALSRSGVILAVCSKNNETDVLEAWEKNPFMVLRKEHFATWRINWTDKATNIREMAEELNLGLDSFVFVDDNPSERELIRQTLPMVEVPEFPSRPYELPVFFKELVDKYFRVYAITGEDRLKTGQYKANARRAQARKEYSDLQSFIASLDIRITVEAANDFNIPRIAQMTQKTNQFNLTTRRYTDTDVRERVLSGWKVWCIGVEDKFGDNGITGCVMVDGDTVDTFLLSCRILGKGIETAFLKQILRLLKADGVKSVKASYLPTAKNAQVRDFYDRCGFSCVNEEPDGNKSYVLDLDKAGLDIEPYYQFILK